MRHTIVEVPITSDTTTYAAGDVVGEKMTIPAVAGKGGRGSVESIYVIDKAGQGIAMDLMLFSDDLSAASTITDNANFECAVADALNIVGVIALASSDWYTISTGTTPKVGYRNDLNIPIQADGEGRIYGVMISRGTPTFTDSDDLLLKLGILRD